MEDLYYEVAEILQNVFAKRGSIRTFVYASQTQVTFIYLFAKTFCIKLFNICAEATFVLLCLCVNVLTALLQRNASNFLE